VLNLTKEEIALLELCYSQSSAGSWFISHTDDGQPTIDALFRAEDTGLEFPMQTRLASMEVYENDDGTNDARFVVTVHNLFPKILAILKGEKNENSNQ
jgi:hypothetical protein